MIGTRLHDRHTATRVEADISRLDICTLVYYFPRQKPYSPILLRRYIQLISVDLTSSIIAKM